MKLGVGQGPRMASSARPACGAKLKLPVPRLRRRQGQGPAQRITRLADGLVRRDHLARLNRPVRRLLKLARAKAPQLRQDERCDFAEVVRDAVAPYAAAGMRLEVAVPPAAVMLAAETLRAVLVNLLDNVRQHAGPGATCRLEAEQGNGMVRLRTTDDGPGISPGNAGRVFERFFTTAREAGGTGLGLTIVRSRLEAAGSSIRLERAALGATFLVVLPAG
jgi:signal transduction histidine kinase